MRLRLCGLRTVYMYYQQNYDHIPPYTYVDVIPLLNLDSLSLCFSLTISLSLSLSLSLSIKLSLSQVLSLKDNRAHCPIQPASYLRLTQYATVTYPQQIKFGTPVGRQHVVNFGVHTYCLST